MQRFQVESDDPKSCTWRVIDYRYSDKTHCIEHDGEEEVCHFDLPIDFLNGDSSIVMVM